MTCHLPLTALITCCALASFGQNGGPLVIEGRFDQFTTDELGHVYALRGDELELYDKAGRSVQRNSVKTFGSITSISAFYSLKPMVFSAAQGQLAVLDNTLSVQGSIMNLPRLGFPQVVMACMSVQNGFWFFDERELTLARVDAQLRPLSNSGRLDQLLGFTPHPAGMLEHDGFVYLNDPDEGILVFDLFGTYVRTIPLMQVAGFQVRGRQLFHFTEEGLLVYDMRTFGIDAVPLPQVDAVVLQARVERDRLYVRTADRIIVHELPEP